jgi:transcriptional regulator with XRE-family HTH domain
MNKIKQFRLKKDLSMRQVSDGSGIPYRTLQDWERGSRKPRDVYQLQKLAEFYKCHIEDLLD